MTTLREAAQQALEANRIEIGDCRDTMRRWATEGVKAQMCVTSPPYFGLRDYGHPGQLGLEQTPEEYIAAMVEVFRCVRDVLAEDGTLWLNIGDSYASSPPGNKTVGVSAKSGLNGVNGSSGVYRETPAAGHATKRDTSKLPGIKPKDLIGIPWMLAFALRADGWYLRQDIIWHKPNPMPESVRDRCTKAHEYIFLLSKSERYFFDSKAMKEPVQSNKGNAKSFRGGGSYTGGNAFNNHRLKERDTQGNAPNEDGTRNRRSVWSVATRPYKGAHFATFPPALIEPCILAGSRSGDIVLDPFMGSGTTAVVALQHGRQYLGCELNAQYATLQNERLLKAMMEKTVNDTQFKLFKEAEPCRYADQCNEEGWCTNGCEGRAALAEPVQEPVAWIDDSGHPKHLSHLQSATERRLYGPLRPLYTTPPPAEPVQEQPVCDECGKHKQDGWALYCVGCVEPLFTSKTEPVEPVAWMNTEDGFCTLDSPVEGIDVMSQWVPLYGSPPQRQAEPVQEPVAWYHVPYSGNGISPRVSLSQQHEPSMYGAVVPLYLKEQL